MMLLRSSCAWLQYTPPAYIVLEGTRLYAMVLKAILSSGAVVSTRRPPMGAVERSPFRTMMLFVISHEDALQNTPEPFDAMSERRSASSPVVAPTPPRLFVMLQRSTVTTAITPLTAPPFLAMIESVTVKLPPKALRAAPVPGPSTMSVSRMDKTQSKPLTAVSELA